jgi:hypothetical protein
MLNSTQSIVRFHRGNSSSPGESLKGKNQTAIKKASDGRQYNALVSLQRAEVCRYVLWHRLLDEKFGKGPQRDRQETIAKEINERYQRILKASRMEAAGAR